MSWLTWRFQGPHNPTSGYISDLFWYTLFPLALWTPNLSAVFPLLWGAIAEGACGDAALWLTNSYAFRFFWEAFQNSSPPASRLTSLTHFPQASRTSCLMTVIALEITDGFLSPHRGQGTKETLKNYLTIQLRTHLSESFPLLLQKGASPFITFTHNHWFDLLELNE